MSVEKGGEDNGTRRVRCRCSGRRWSQRVYGKGWGSLWCTGGAEEVWALTLGWKNRTVPQGPTEDWRVGNTVSRLSDLTGGGKDLPWSTSTSSDRPTPPQPPPVLSTRPLPSDRVEVRTPVNSGRSQRGRLVTLLQETRNSFQVPSTSGGPSSLYGGNTGPM